MRKTFLKAVLILVVMAAAFVAGRWMERAKSGYHYKVLEEKEMESEFGPVRWKTVMEYVGLPFFVNETTLIEVEERTIYKAKRVFQEHYPLARNVRVNNGLIEWEDGEYSFSLRMQKMAPQTSTGTAPATNPQEIR